MDNINLKYDNLFVSIVSDKNVTITVNNQTKRIVHLKTVLPSLLFTCSTAPG